MASLRHTQLDKPVAPKSVRVLFLLRIYDLNMPTPMHSVLPYYANRKHCQKQIWYLQAFVR